MPVNSLGWASLKPRAGNTFHVAHKGGQESNHLSHPLLPPSVHGQEAGLVVEPGTQVWGVDIPSSVLTAELKACPSLGIF